jgi:hypothetical protein
MEKLILIWMAAVCIVSALILDRMVEYAEAPDGYVMALAADMHEIDRDELTGVVTAIERRDADVLLLSGGYSSKKIWI